MSAGVGACRRRRAWLLGAEPRAQPLAPCRAASWRGAATRTPRRERRSPSCSGGALHRRSRRATRGSGARRGRARDAGADARRARGRGARAGKHCFVEKPLAQSAADAERVVSAAARGRSVLMVGHLLEYHPGVRALKELVDSGELGELRYIYGNRLNLGAAARGRERALEPRRARRVGGARARRRGALRVWRPAANATCATASRTSSSASCGSRRASPRTSTSAGSTRTRSAASPWSARGGWRRSTTWSPSAR